MSETMNPLVFRGEIRPIYFPFSGWKIERRDVTATENPQIIELFLFPTAWLAARKYH